MYITESYWGEYMGGTDDSLTLLEYLAAKGREEISVGEILSDFGLDKLEGNFRRPKVPVVYTDDEGGECAICYAIDLITDLAVLLLECDKNGGLDTQELEMDTHLPALRITAAPRERALLVEALRDFAAHPLDYDLGEMVPEEEMREMAALCGELQKEL